MNKNLKKKLSDLLGTEILKRSRISVVFLLSVVTNCNVDDMHWLIMLFLHTTDTPIYQSKKAIYCECIHGSTTEKSI